MNVRLTNVLSDITGVTGLKIIRTILAVAGAIPGSWRNFAMGALQKERGRDC